VARRAQRLGVRQNGRLSVSQGHSLASNCPDITQQPAHTQAPFRLYVPETSSMSCDQVIFVYQATDASLSSDAVIVESGQFG
jgi:hypothetical protein